MLGESPVPHILNNEATGCRADCCACKWEAEHHLEIVQAVRQTLGYHPTPELVVAWREEQIEELERIYALEDSRGN